MMTPDFPAMIATIWRLRGLGHIQTLTPAASGSRNPCYIVNDTLVIRFNTRDLATPKFENERAAYALLAPHGLPVPTVIALDEQPTAVPYAYSVVTRLPGRNIAESWRELDPNAIRQLAWEAGAMLARLHALSFSRFGKLRALASQPFPTWAAYFADYTRRYREAAERRHLLDAPLRQRLDDFAHDAQALLAPITTGALIHSDYHYENLLHEGGRLSGLLDFEWALSGDPTYDFIAATARERMLPGSEATFLAGYQSRRQFDAAHQQRLAIYNGLLQLETAVMLANEGDRAAAVATLRTLAAPPSPLG